MPGEDDLNAVCDEFVKVARPALPQWNVFSYQPDAPVVPCLFPLMPDLIEYDITFGRGGDRFLIPILGLVSRTADETGQRLLRSLVSGNGALKTALEAMNNNPATGGGSDVWMTSRIVQMDKAGPTELAPGEIYFGAQLTWEVYV